MITDWISAKYRGLLVALIAGAAVWVMNQFGLFSLPGGWLYDRFVGFSAARSYQPHVVLVGIPAERRVTPGEWRRVFQTLQRLRAAQLVVLAPDETDAGFFAEAAQTPNLLLGRYLLDDQTDPAKPRLQTWPEAGAGIPYGIATLPLPEQGIYRTSPVSQRVEGEPVPSLAVAAVRQRGIDSPRDSATGFIINFNQGRYSLPIIRLERLLSGDLIEELVSGRSVLIGPMLGLSALGLHTPVTTDTTPMSALEFQGHALDTLLGDRVITELPVWVVLLWLSAVTVVSVFVYQWLRVNESVWITVAALVIYLLVGWAVLRFLWVRLPVLELVTAQALIFFWVTHEKSSRMEREMRTMLAEMSTRLRTSALPPRFYDTPHHWEQLVAMVDQTLSLTRLIFLERVEADHRVREIQA
ncbi:MAG: CHASE2 domain-containing protein, partial [Candidatus Thiodiazotropha sp. (ex Dulcina madagascariensis)]|nr:CHASE2 domain-containing protein [Candidatus Thiodiazotropha sp. (ex Dulcina madagascariensis)]